jgi:hypothetical protein
MLLENEAMSLPFLLCDLVTSNVMAAFASERDALETLRESAAADGVASIENLSLLLILDGDPTLIAMEDDLVRRATGDDIQSNGNADGGVRRSRRVAS